MEKRSLSKLHGVGRRKSAVARVWLKRGNGGVLVNGKKYDEYFGTQITKDIVKKPLKITGVEKDFAVDVNIQGGGINSQAEAIGLGISRALVVFDEKFRSLLRKGGLLTVDSRVKERKKYGRKAARRSFQFVKR